jgi:hypothetical protein
MKMKNATVEMKPHFAFPVPIHFRFTSPSLAHTHNFPLFFKDLVITYRQCRYYAPTAGGRKWELHVHIKADTIGCCR